LTDNVLTSVTLDAKVYNCEDDAIRDLLDQRFQMPHEPGDFMQLMICRNVNSKNREDSRAKMEEDWRELRKLTGKNVVEDACVFGAQIMKMELTTQVDGELQRLVLFRKFTEDAIAESNAAQVFRKTKYTAKMLECFRHTPDIAKFPIAITKFDVEKLIPSLRFLRTMTKNTFGNELETAVLKLLLTIRIDNRVSNVEKCVSFLHDLELHALLMFLSKESKEKRQERTSKIMKRGISTRKRSLSVIYCLPRNGS